MSSHSQKLQRLYLWFHTVRYFKPKQVFFRLFYPLRNTFFPPTVKRTYSGSLALQSWGNAPYNAQSFLGAASFSFLNIEHHFDREILWNHSAYGRLWTYNLNYFDFLNQENLSREEGLSLILDYLNKEAGLVIGKEPYPTSLRIVNWIKFVSRYQINDAGINQFIFRDVNRLSRNLEFHVLGNHLLENGLAIFLGAVFFRDNRFLEIAKDILDKELKEQILNDGAHFERSPMYHRILLHRLLDCYKFAVESEWASSKPLVHLLKLKSISMLSWLAAVTYPNGDTPMVKDSAHGIGLPSQTLFEYGKTLALNWQRANLSDSAYRKYTDKNYECFMDIGGPSPDYQPGHAHADTFNFELWYKGKAVIIDPGISTYEAGPARDRERSTVFHNTVSVDGRNSSEVWGVFRVAKRARVKVWEDSPQRIKVSHNGFRSVGNKHQRVFQFKKSGILMLDLIEGKSEKAEAFFHLAPDLKVKASPEQDMVMVGEIQIQFKGAVALKTIDYACPLGFNKVTDAQKIIVTFSKELRTTINFPN